MPDEADKEPPLLPEGEIVRLNDSSETVMWALAICAVGIGLFFILVTPSRPGAITGPGRPVLGLAWVLWGLLIASRTRMGLVVSQEGITVRYRFHASSYKWSEVKEFRLRQWGPRKALRIELENGRRIGASGFGASSPRDIQTAENVVAELNRRLDAARSGT